MTRVAAVIVVAVGAGMAFATPAFAQERGSECPQVPPSSDFESARSGDLSLQVGGIGIGGSRSRSRSQSDVMFRYGRGFEDWSAAAVMAHSCHMNRRLYRHDPRRQRDEFVALRDRLLAQPPASRAAPSRATATRGWTFREMWEPLSTRTFMPRPALSAGLSHGNAQVNCRLSQGRGLDDCYVVSETPRGYGFGGAVVRYLGTLRLRNELLSFSWEPRRLDLDVRIATYM